MTHYVIRSTGADESIAATIAQRLAQVQSRIGEACARYGRDPARVRLLAVGKKHPAAALRALYQLGQRAFGENRLQEALDKQRQLEDLDLEWHFIGPVQSNKTRAIAERFDWVQSVDRAKVLRRLAEQRPETAEPLQVLLQVNIDAEPQKAGATPAQARELAELASGYPRLALRGLMCLPAAHRPAPETRASFARLRDLAEQLADRGHRMDTLSMGMSGDLELAIAEGSTMVRIGTDLFGPRPGGHGSGPKLTPGK
jgi:pyridoxal phosphate enzyme (YggS family)